MRQTWRGDKLDQSKIELGVPVETRLRAFELWPENLMSDFAYVCTDMRVDNAGLARTLRTW